MSFSPFILWSTVQNRTAGPGRGPRGGVGTLGKPVEGGDFSGALGSGQGGQALGPRLQGGHQALTCMEGGGTLGTSDPALRLEGPPSLCPGPGGPQESLNPIPHERGWGGPSGIGSWASLLLPAGRGPPAPQPRRPIPSLYLNWAWLCPQHQHSRPGSPEGHTHLRGQAHLRAQDHLRGQANLRDTLT